MKSIVKHSVAVLLIASSAMAQSGTPGKKKTSAKPAYATQQDLEMLRLTLQQQQQLLQQMQQQMQQRDQQLQQTQQQLAEAQAAAREAQSKAASIETASNEQNATVTQLKSDVSDVKLNMTNAATSTQEDQKRVATLEGILGRFRFNGDVRVRYENFYLNNTPDRNRFRIRARFGTEGKLNEDFVGGIYLATGAQTDPTTTNETLTNVFERKNFFLDRGYITYNPAAHKWLSLTGGKFAYSWTRTSDTFDSDINPEGFSQKLSFDMKSSVFKNVNFTGMQLFFNESSSGTDSFAVGGQVGAKLQLGSIWTMTPTYTVLNWRNANVILNEPFTTTGRIVIPAGGGSPINGVFAPNGQTNATCLQGTTTVYCSQFLYSDLIINNQIKTPIAKLPVNVIGEYLVNLNAANNRSHAYYGEVSVGQTKDKRDFQAGYSFNRQEQDSAISSFTESDQRSPTNVLQHRFFFNYKIQKNTTLGFTEWIGRTLDSNAPNALLVTGYPAGTRQPYLKRGQFDVVYTF